jgi:hypothetical protein
MGTLRLPGSWQRDFDRQPFRFSHELASHPALQLDFLRDVVLSLPREQVFASRADLKIDTDFDRAHVSHAIDQSLEATLADMATTNSYVMVRKPDSDPRLREVLELFTSELGEYVKDIPQVPVSLLSRKTRAFHDPMLYLFISSPNSVTPFHVDRYSTLLLQLRGSKNVMIWDREDRETVTREELEFLFGRPYQNNPNYKGAHTREPEVFSLQPGEGVHIPFTSPQWVKNGPEVSVSVSFIWQTGASLRQANAHQFNYLARSVLSRFPAGIPRPELRAVGVSPLIDATKASLTKSWFGIRRRLAG